MNKKIKRAISVLLTAVSVVLLVFSAFAAEKTSFSYRYPVSFASAKNIYPDLGKILHGDKELIPIPGLEKTVFPDGKVCNTMVPQGICRAGGYILVTAYDSEKKFNTVIYVISAEDKTLKGLIVTPDKNHSGGICFDGERVYVARSTEKETGVIELSEIEEAAQNGFYTMKDFKMKLPCDTTASFITFFDGLIYVGLYGERTKGVLTGYRYSDGKLIKAQEYILPENAQGGAFISHNGKTYFVLSASFGRTNASCLTVYECNDGKMTEVNSLLLPPMSEEVEFIDGRLYIMFESSATEYSTKLFRCIFPVDRICEADFEDILNTRPGFFDPLLLFFNRVFFVISGLFG